MDFADFPNFERNYIGLSGGRGGGAGPCMHWKLKHPVHARAHAHAHDQFHDRTHAPCPRPNPLLCPRPPPAHASFSLFPSQDRLGGSVDRITPWSSVASEVFGEIYIKRMVAEQRTRPGRSAFALKLVLVRAAFFAFGRTRCPSHW